MASVLTSRASGLILLAAEHHDVLSSASASGRLTLRFGGKWVLLAGSAISVVPFLMLVLADDRQWEIVVAMALMGAGFGLAFSAMSNLIVEACRVARPVWQAG